MFQEFACSTNLCRLSLYTNAYSEEGWFLRKVVDPYVVWWQHTDDMAEIRSRTDGKVIFRLKDLPFNIDEERLNLLLAYI